MPLATSPAAPFASASSTFPLSVTTPSLVVTCTWLPLTRSSAKGAILVLDVIQESLTPVFTSWVVLLILSLVLSALSSTLSFVVGLSALVCAKAGPVAKTSAAMLRLVTAIRCRIVHGSSRKIGSLPYRLNLGHLPLQHMLALHDPSPRAGREHATRAYSRLCKRCAELCHEWTALELPVVQCFSMGRANKQPACPRQASERVTGRRSYKVDHVRRCEGEQWLALRHVPHRS